jgi:hypothetical protein
MAKLVVVGVSKDTLRISLFECTIRPLMSLKKVIISETLKFEAKIRNKLLCSWMVEVGKEAHCPSCFE